ncbi:MAG: HEPN domain-containing protein [archaeon]|nr:HEPN domain-containing protein [archaeon]MCP8306363.1 HEPN domain-containing protein [archaeon]
MSSEGLYPKAHEGTVKMFGRRIIKGKGLPRSLGAGFSRLKTLREKADYSPKIEVTEPDVEWSIEFAERFLNQMKVHLESEGKI